MIDAQSGKPAFRKGSGKAAQTHHFLYKAAHIARLLYKSRGESCVSTHSLLESDKAVA